MKKLLLKFTTIFFLVISLQFKVYSTCSCSGTSIGSNSSSITYSNSFGSTTLSGSYCLYGTLYINSANFTFNNINLKMDAYAKIYINDGKTLNIINSSNIHACDNTMWDKILVGNGSSIYITDGSEISDGIEAVTTGWSINPTVWLDDVKFNKNLNSIYIGNGCTGASYFNKVRIASETSVGSAVPSNLLSPKSSQRGHLGVGFYNVPSFTLTSSDYTFEFRYLDIGMTTSRSSYTLENAFFRKCDLGLNVLNPNLNTAINIQNNTFEDCPRSIYGGNLSRSTLNINHNNLYDFTNTGIQLQTSWLSNIYIGSNLLNYKIDGIDYVPNEWEVTKRGLIGIYVSNPIGLGSQNLAIWGNYIANCDRSIIAQNINEVSTSGAFIGITTNTINIEAEDAWLDNHTAFPSIGIISENCRKLGIVHNIIFRNQNTTFDAGDRIVIFGIINRNSINTDLNLQWIRSRDIYDNHTYNISNSISPQYNNLGMGFLCNKMVDPYFGITFINANLTNQPPPILGQSAAVVTGNAFFDDNCGSMEYRHNGNIVNPITWKHWGTSTFPNYVYPFDTHTTNILLVQLGFGSHDMCAIPPEPFEFEDTVSESEMINSILGDIVHNNLEFSDHSDQWEKASWQYAFKTLTENPEWKAKDVYCEEFYHWYSQTNDAVFASIDSAILDSNFTYADDLISNFIPEDDWEAAKILCYQYFMKVNIQEIIYEELPWSPVFEIQEGIQENLEIIAYGDYFTYGEAIYFARAILGIVIDEQPNELRKGNIESTTFKNLVYPNPTSEILYVKLDEPNYNRRIKLTIYNQLGIEVFSEAGTGNSSFNLLNLNAGLYLYQVKFENDQTLYGKFIKK
jgi:hypothetical protein